MSEIIIVGLGPGDPALLTRAAWDVLSSAGRIYARTRRHPTFDGLPASVQVESFDHLYDAATDFETVYRAIAEQVLALAADSARVVYAVPGHPTVGEASVALIRSLGREAGHSVRLLPGISFIEPALDALELDALPGLVLADALELAARHHPPFDPDTPALISQVYSRAVASDVKLTLMNQYPDEHPVVLLHGLSTPHAAVRTVPLHTIDRDEDIAHLTLLYVPPLERHGAFERLQEIVAHLRAPEGCPWDREQTHASLRKGLMEETWEALEAIDNDDMSALREELGDLLLMVVMQTQIATEHAEFQMAEVIDGIVTKLVRRHPHVFGDAQAASASAVTQQWEQLKAEERAARGDTAPKGMLDGVPKTMPALALADAYQSRVARVGFDWDEIEPVVEKIFEEIDEVKAAKPEDQADEMGDLLFAVVNWARWLKIDPEAALRSSCARFGRRFAHVEQAARSNGRDMKAMSLAELDTLWEAAKLEVG